MARVKKERAQTKAERDAFQEFALRVAAVKQERPSTNPSRPEQPGLNGAAVTIRDSDGTMTQEGALQSVRQTYQKAVMAVSHFDSEYGESLEENMAQEFGADITTAVMDGEFLTAELKNMLLKRAQMCVTERDEFLNELEEEQQSVVTARRTLRDVQRKFDTIEERRDRRSVRELLNDWARLDNCEELLVERQSHLQDWGHARSPHRVQVYLYPDIPWTYPILNDGLDGVRRIRDTKRAVVGALSKWR